MLKRLVVFGLLALGVLASAEKPLPMKRSQQQQQSQPKNQSAQPSAPLVGAIGSETSSEVDKENAANRERYAYYKAHPKEYLKAAFAPANLSNWILAGLGVVGGVFAALPLGTIKRQVNLQSAAIQQWVDIESRGVETFTTPENGIQVRMRFEALNNTPYLFTIQNIETRFGANTGEEIFNVRETVRLPPSRKSKSSAYAFHITTASIGRDNIQRGVMLTVNGTVVFKDCLDRKQEQWFSFSFDLGLDGLIPLCSLGMVPSKDA